MTPADLQIPERESAPVVEDPAVAAGKKAAEAAAAFNATAAKGDETSPEWVAAEKRTTEADAAFADAPVTSIAGALAKMREIAALDADDDGTSLNTRHIKTVAAFLEGFAGAPSAVDDDPAVVALAEFKVAKAADDAISGKDAEAETPEYQATGDRLYAARDAVYDSVPTSMAGMAAKIRWLFDYGERGNDLWVPFDTMAKSMLPFEGAPAPAPKPDPVITMSAEWGAIYDEMTALSAANPENKSGELMDRWEAALERVRALEDRIIETPATSIAGVAIKLRIATDWSGGSPNVSALHATPAREIDYEKVCIVVEGNSKPVISALIDAERLAGVS